MVASYGHIHQYIKVSRSPKLAQRSYGQIKNHNFQKNKKMSPDEARTTHLPLACELSMLPTTLSNYLAMKVANNSI